MVKPRSNLDESYSFGFTILKETLIFARLKVKGWSVGVFVSYLKFPWKSYKSIVIYLSNLVCSTSGPKWDRFF